MARSRASRVTRLAGLAALLLLAGCTTIGPNFAAPDPAFDKDWVSPSLAGIATTGADRAWWDQFNDPALTALVAAAEAGNNNVRIAGLRVLEARASLGAARSALSPQSVTATASGGYGASAPGGIALSRADALFGTVGVSAGWEIDFWGRFQRGIESADANYLAQIASREDLGLLIRAETARAYLGVRTIEERLAAARANVKLQQRSVEITSLLFRQGAESELDLQQAKAQLLATEATIPAFEQALVQTKNGLNALLGRPPGEVPELALSPPRLPAIPDHLAADVPADYLRRRPDVRAAAFRAGAQSAQIGLAKGELYPHLALVGGFNLTRTTEGGLTNKVELGIGPSISWNFLDFGRIRNNVRVQDARFEQALAAYRETVLQAANDVDNNAIAFTKGREEDAVLDQTQQAAKRSLDLATLRYREGISDFQRVLDAQAALLRAQDRYISNRGEVATSLVRLYKALGGGWRPATEADFADQPTRDRMGARTNWGDLLPPVPAKTEAPK
jgi:NodT family efflux transporter outer membrane factor (OMF) lipoprotein